MDNRFLGFKRKIAPKILQHISEITGHEVYNAVGIEAMMQEDIFFFCHVTMPLFWSCKEKGRVCLQYFKENHLPKSLTRSQV